MAPERRILWHRLISLFLFTLLFLPGPLSTGSTGLPDPFPVRGEGQYVSPSGAVLIEDLDVTRILGEKLPKIGAQLGQKVELGDNNSDGHPDLFLYSLNDCTDWPPPPSKQLTHRRYVIELDGTRLPEVIDMEEEKYPFFKLDLETAMYYPDITCDLDGDGYLDRIIGSPEADDPGRGLAKCGRVQLLFNHTDGSPDRTVNIYGDDAHDGFGSDIEMMDLDGDGFEDIIAGAPYSKGFDDVSLGVGELLIFMGRKMIGYPTYMNAEAEADIRIEGHEGYHSGFGEYQGDRLGRRLDICDIDGDGEKELMVPLFKKTPPEDLDERYGCGVILVYDKDDLYGRKNSTFKLEYPSPSMTIEGVDMEDSLGFDLCSGDIDEDGFQDLVVACPGADGIDNERKQCGEIIIIWGSGLFIDDIESSGPGVEGDRLYCKGGHVLFEVPSFVSTRSGQVESASLELYKGDSRIGCQFEGGSTFLTGDTAGALAYDPVHSYLASEGEGYTLSFMFYLGWYAPFKGAIDVMVELHLSSGVTIYRTYEGRFEVVKDLAFQDRPSFSVDGRQIEETGSRCLVGQELVVRPPELVYSLDPVRSPIYGSVALKLLMDGDTVDEGEIGLDLEYSTTVTSETSHTFLFSAEPSEIEHEKDLWAPEISDCPPRVLIVDRGPPDAVKDVDIGYRKVLGTDHVELSFNGTLGRGGDGGGSGTQRFDMSIDGGPFEPIRERGGLTATYFSDPDFEKEEVVTVEEKMDIAWGPWSPEPNLIPPYGYSVRWHGWIKNDVEGPFRLLCSGRGLMRVLIDGKEVLPWSDLFYSPETADVDNVKDNPYHEVQVHYRLLSGESRVLMKLEDDLDHRTVLGGDLVYHPATGCLLTGYYPEHVPLRIRSMDWTGRATIVGAGGLYVDHSAPVIHRPQTEGWYCGDEEMNITVEEKKNSLGDCSGINLSSFRYRFYDDDIRPLEWKDDITAQSVLEGTDEKVVIVDISFPVPGRDLYGNLLQVEIRDNGGNLVQDEWVVKVDRGPPSVEMGAYSIRQGDIVPFLRAGIEAADPVSGVDGSTLEWRYNSTVWTKWLPIPVNLSGSPVSCERDLDLGYGVYLVQFAVSDAAGNRGTSEVYSFDIAQDQVNSPPVPAICSPLNGDLVVRGNPVVLNAQGTSDDGLGPFSPARMSWYSNLTGFIGTGHKLSFVPVPGYHRITLYADDGEYNVSTSVEIEVVSPDLVPGEGTEGDPDHSSSDEGTLIWVLIIGSILGVLFTLLLIMLLSRREDMVGPSNQNER